VTPARRRAALIKRAWHANPLESPRCGRRMKIVSFINPWQWDVTLSRLFRDGGPWKSSDSFGRDDLLLAAKVRSAAHSRIYELQAE